MPCTTNDWLFCLLRIGFVVLCLVCVERNEQIDRTNLVDGDETNEATVIYRLIGAKRRNWIDTTVQLSQSLLTQAVLAQLDSCEHFLFSKLQDHFSRWLIKMQLSHAALSHQVTGFESNSCENLIQLNLMRKKKTNKFPFTPHTLTQRELFLPLSSSAFRRCCRRRIRNKYFMCKNARVKLSQRPTNTIVKWQNAVDSLFCQNDNTKQNQNWKS